MREKKEKEKNLLVGEKSVTVKKWGWNCKNIGENSALQSKKLHDIIPTVFIVFPKAYASSEKKTAVGIAGNTRKYQKWLQVIGNC